MNRTFILGLTLLLLGVGLLAIGSGAFTAAEADRPISVNVVDDEDALLGLETDVTEETTGDSNEYLDANDTDTTDTDENDTTDGNGTAATTSNETIEPTDNETDDETNTTSTPDDDTVCQLEVTVTNRFPHAIDDVTVQVDGGGESFDLAVGESETATFEVDQPGEDVEVVVTVEDERVSVDLTRSVAGDRCSG